MNTTRLYVVVLGLNGLFALALGVVNLLAFPQSMPAIGIPVTHAHTPLGILMGMQFLLQGVLLLVAIRWTQARNTAGLWVGGLVGGYLLTFTTLAVLQTDHLILLLADGPRGMALLGLALRVGRSWRNP